MHFTDFVQAYPLDISEEHIHGGEYSQLITEAQAWSYKFGRRLHNFLTNSQPDTFIDPAEITRYYTWGMAVVDTIVDLTGEALAGNTAALRAMNEFNFNLMNFFMRSMWEPVFHGEWKTDANRRHRIQASQLDLAVAGSIFVNARHQYTDKYGSAAWFDERGVGVLNATITGILQEIDSAIVLLDVVRDHPSWTIIPAPLNFERMGKGDNVDFIVVDSKTQDVVGIQVKTNLNQRTVRRANPERVVFLDGTQDLHNVKAVSTRYDDETKKEVAWPGLIAVWYITQLPANKAKKVVNRSVRAWTRQLVADVRVDINQPARIIEERIVQKM